jgi:acetylornithine deacetylase/succinyl-diaminopimelate desuccinylase-like protein
VPKGKGPINIAKIQGGVQPTWTPNHCELEMEKRLFPSENWKVFHKHLVKHMSGVGRATDAKMEIRALWHADPYLLDTKSNGFKFVSKWAKRRNLKTSFTAGASDLNKIYNFIKSREGRKFTGIRIGPGTLGMGHRSDEYVVLSDLGRSYHLYLDLLKELFEGNGNSLLG